MPGGNGERQEGKAGGTEHRRGRKARVCGLGARRRQVAQATPVPMSHIISPGEPAQAARALRQQRADGGEGGSAAVLSLRTGPAKELPPRPHGRSCKRPFNTPLLAEAVTLLPFARCREHGGEGHTVRRRKGVRRGWTYQCRHARGRRQEPCRPRAAPPDPVDQHGGPSLETRVLRDSRGVLLVANNLHVPCGFSAPLGQQGNLETTSRW